MTLTFERQTRFDRDLARLTPEQQRRFRAGVAGFVADLAHGEGFRPGLRVKRVQGTERVWEMTFAPNGRATWEYGTEVQSGEPHVIWRRVGTHDIFRGP